MKISHAWLETYFDKPLPEPDKLAELFNLHFAEIEAVEKTVNDTVFDIKTLADRNHYALSHRGVAGEAHAITKTPLKAVKRSKIAVSEALDMVTVKVADSKLCPRYMARRIENVKVTESPKWLRQRLEAIGARSINSIVDATNYVMFDLGQPLHAFDAKKVAGGINVRKAKAGEKIVLLDEREVSLTEEDLLIADDEGPLVVAGVKGGKRAEVTNETSSIIIESANFNSTAVRRAGMRIGVRNDSSKRFENEITPVLAEEAMERVTALVLELSPGAKASNVTDVYPTPVSSWTIKAEASHINAITGLSLKAEDMAEILKRLLCDVSVKGEKLLITPPAYRLDMTIEEDVADEIVRIYGYDNLVPVKTPKISPVENDSLYFYSEKTKDVLVSLGFSEVQLYSLVPKGAFEISYPLASDKSALREKIAPKMAEALTRNSLNADLLGLDSIKIFEIGKVFPKQGERAHIALGVMEVKKKKGVTAETRLGEAVKALEKALSIKIEGKIEKGDFGAIIEADFEKVIENLKAGSFNDLSFNSLLRDIVYKPFSQYPYIVRDVAFFASKEKKESDVVKTVISSAHQSAGSLIVKGPNLFDRFEKDEKVSYAFRMIFQSFEKTLSLDEVKGFMEKIYSSLRKEGFEVR